MQSRRSLLTLNLPKDTIALLTRKGYQSVQDIREVSPEKLAADLDLSLQQVEIIVGTCRSQTAPIASLQQSQPASKLFHVSQRVETACRPLDAILDGGLMRGHMLEISGPPGCPKESLLTAITSSFAKAGETVLFVDCATTTTASSLASILQPKDTNEEDLRSRVEYIRVSSLAELLLLCHQLPDIVSSRPNISLLTLGSISFPFQGHDLTMAKKNAHLEKVKQTFSKLCATRNITIVTTSQLSTKMVNSDGSRGTFDSGGRGVMMPPLGMTHLLEGKSWRIMVCPENPSSGFLKRLSCPKHPPGGPEPCEPYSLVNGCLL